MFISSTQRDATSANIADYNTHVQTAAKNGHSAMTDGCGNQFKVVGSTTAVNARDNAGFTETGGPPIYWLGGDKAADDYAEFLDGTQWGGGPKHEDGSDNTSVLWYASGSNTDGTAYSGEELGTTGTNIIWGDFAEGLDRDANGAKTGSYSFLALSPVFEVHVDIQFTEAEVSISENAGEARLTVVMGKARSAATTVNIVLTGGTATAGADFEYEPNQYRVTIPAGDTEASVDIALIDDSAFEPDEVFTASIRVLGGLDLSVGGDATITILDDDLLIQDPPILRVTEGQSATYTLRLAQAPTSAVTVNLVATTMDGTSPVTLNKSSLTITNINWNDPAQHRVTVTAPEDANDMDELVTISHSMTSSDSTFNAKTDDYQVRVGDRQSGKPLITLSHHDESPRSVKGSPRSIEEGQYFLLEVKMSEGYPQQPMVVTFTVTQPGDAEYRPPGAHNRVDTWVTFFPEQYSYSSNTAEVLIWTEDDDTDEPTGELTVTVNTGGAYNVGTTDSLSIEVRDNDIGAHDNGAPCMHCVYITSDSNVTEGSAANVTVHANPAPERDMDVDVWVLDAPQRGDFLNRSDEGRRTVTIPSGSTSASFSLPTRDPAVSGPYGWFTARLSWIEQTDSRFNYRASDSMRETRVNVRMRNRRLPEVSVAGVSLGATDTEGEDLTIRLTADPAPSSPLPVKLTIAVEGDFGVTPGERTVTIGTDGRGTLTLPTDDDSVSEPDGRIEVALKPDSGYTFGQTVSYSVQILDNDGGGILGSPVPETQGDTVSPPEPPLVKYASVVKRFYDKLTSRNQHGDGPEGGWNKRFLKAMGHPEYINYPQAAVTVARATELYNHGGPGANTAWAGTAEAIQYKLDYDAGSE